jgi:hypothetical protein
MPIPHVLGHKGMLFHCSCVDLRTADIKPKFEELILFWKSDLIHRLSLKKPVAARMLIGLAPLPIEDAATDTCRQRSKYMLMTILGYSLPKEKLLLYK